MAQTPVNRYGRAHAPPVIADATAHPRRLQRSFGGTHVHDGRGLRSRPHLHRGQHLHGWRAVRDLERLPLRIFLSLGNLRPARRFGEFRRFRRERLHRVARLRELRCRQRLLQRRVRANVAQLLRSHRWRLRERLRLLPAGVHRREHRHRVQGQHLRGLRSLWQ